MKICSWKDWKLCLLKPTLAKGSDLNTCLLVVWARGKINFLELTWIYIFNHKWLWRIFPSELCFMSYRVYVTSVEEMCFFDLNYICYYSSQFHFKIRFGKSCYSQKHKENPPNLHPVHFLLLERRCLIITSVMILNYSSASQWFKLLTWFYKTSMCL